MFRRGFIVPDVCKTFGISREEFYARRRTPELIEARCAAIWALRNAGMSTKAIARMVKRDHTTICYWLHPEWRERKREVMRRRRAGRLA